MRFLENLFIKLFSLVIFAGSIMMILTGLNIIEYDGITNIVKFLLDSETNKKVTLIFSIISAVVSLKILFTNNGKPKTGKDGIILENSSGKLIISKESLDNLIFNAAKDIPGADNITSKTYLDLEQNLRVFVTVNITQDVSIKELSTTLQSKIKSAIKQTADLDVSEVNVKIKNIVNKKTRKIKDSYESKKEELPTVIEENPMVEPTNDVEEYNETNNE